MGDFLEDLIDGVSLSPSDADYYVSYVVTEWLDEARTMSKTDSVDLYFRESALEHYTIEKVRSLWPDREVSDYRLSYLDRPWHDVPPFTEDENGCEVGSEVEC